MARFDVHQADLVAMGAQVDSGEFYFQLGMTYAVGRGVQQDRVAAHKWFNLAAAEGNTSAARYRQEMAGEMSKAEIAEALRQARSHMKLH